jgi:hypothetical protein
MEAALAGAVAGAARGEIILPPDLAGFPGTAHGGAVAALCWRLALPRPPARIRLSLLRGVPVGTALGLRTAGSGSEARLALVQGDRTLAEATVSREAVAVPPDVREIHAAWTAGHAGGHELPGTMRCLACGRANPLGLAVRFLANARYLWREVTPGSAYRSRDGDSHPALATVLLDELGWWLGALAAAECGVTTEVDIALFRPLPFRPLLVVGDRARVAPDADARDRYLRTEGLLLDSAGEPLAAARIRFAGSRAYTRRLLQPFLETTPLAGLSRLFPSAAALAGRPAGDGAEPDLA